MTYGAYKILHNFDVVLGGFECAEQCQLVMRLVISLWAAYTVNRQFVELLFFMESKHEDGF